MDRLLLKILLIAVCTIQGAQSTAVEKLGCFKDQKSDRALGEFIADFRTRFRAAIELCAEKAKKKGYHYFGVQYYGECWSAPDSKASESYKIHGPSDNCVNGVGGHFANMVYKINT